MRVKSLKKKKFSLWIFSTELQNKINGQHIFPNYMYIFFVLNYWLHDYIDESHRKYEFPFEVFLKHVSTDMVQHFTMQDGRSIPLEY